MSLSGTNSDASSSQDYIRTTSLSAIRGQVLSNPVRVLLSIIQLEVLILSMERLLKP